MCKEAELNLIIDFVKRQENIAEIPEYIVLHNFNIKITQNDINYSIHELKQQYKEEDLNNKIIYLNILNNYKNVLKMTN